MSRQQRLIDCLQQALPLDHIDVLNESHQHRGPADAETHFKVILVSPVFDGLRSVQRHQKIYGLLTQEFAAGLHALALHTYTPVEWQATGAAPASPACQHRREA